MEEKIFFCNKINRELCSVQQVILPQSKAKNDFMTQELQRSVEGTL